MQTHMPSNPCRGTSPKSFPVGVWVEVPIDKLSLDAGGTDTFTFEPSPNEGFFEFGGIYFSGFEGDGDGDGDGDIDTDKLGLRMTQVNSDGDDYLNRKTGPNNAGIDGSGYALVDLTREALYGHGCCDGYKRGGPAGRLFQSITPIKEGSSLVVTVTSTAGFGVGVNGGCLLVRRIPKSEAPVQSAVA